MVATGIAILVLMLLVVAISPASNGQEKTGASGMGTLVVLLLVMAISSHPIGKREQL